MAHSPLAVLVVAGVCALAACGSSSSAGAALSPASVKSCLKSHGLRVLGGPVDSASRGDSGVTAELIARNSFIAFYPSDRVADQQAPRLRTNAARLRGSVVRRGTVSILFVGVDPPQGPRQTILHCA
jgi:hypothetical protein